MRVSVADSIEQLQALENDWEELYGDAVNANIFLSFDWIFTWLKHYSFNVSHVRIFCVWDDSQLVAVLPLYKKTSRFSIEYWFIGTGEPEACEVCSEYQDILCKTGLEARVVNVFSELFKNERNILGLRLPNVRENALLKALLGKLPARFMIEQRACGQRFFIPTKNGIAATKLTQKSRRYLNVFNRLPQAMVTEPQSETEVIESFDTLTALHNARWQKRLATTIFENAHFNRFHRDLIIKLFRQERLSMMIIKVEERDIAAIYCMQSGNDMVYYQSGHDDSFRPNISAGNLSHFFQASKAANKHFDSYDLLASKSADSYKSKLVECQEPIYSISFYRSRFLRFLANFTLRIERLTSHTS